MKENNLFAAATDKADEWLNDLVNALDARDKHEAYRVFRAVVFALREQLTPEESCHLAAQLPLILRGVYFEGWKPRKLYMHSHTRKEFFENVSGHYDGPPRFHPEKMARAVFATLSLHVTEGELEQIQDLLSPQLRGLWPTTPAKLAEAWS